MPQEQLDRLRQAVTAQHSRPRSPWGGKAEVKSRAAVAMIFSPPKPAVARARGERGLELLMIKRAEHKGDPWSGHMAFPGGRVDPGDVDPAAAAARETLEEVGLDLSDAEPLGPLPPLHTPPRVLRATMAIHPFVFTYDRPLPPLTPEAKEVASLHRFALSRLLADEGRATFPWKMRGQTLRMPCILMDGCRIWGLSLSMLDDLLERLRELDP